jgi:branched-chain amino acid transport system permease protein
VDDPVDQQHPRHEDYGDDGVHRPVVGAFLVIGLEHYLAQFGAWVTIIQGCVFVLCVLLFREGIIGLIARVVRRPL